MRNDEIEEIERNDQESEKNTLQHLNTKGTHERIDNPDKIKQNKQGIDKKIWMYMYMLS